MIENGFLKCPDCHKKIQPVYGHDTISSTVYCMHCKIYYKIVIADGELFKMEIVKL